MARKIQAKLSATCCLCSRPVEGPEDGVGGQWIKPHSVGTGRVRWVHCDCNNPDANRGGKNGDAAPVTQVEDEPAPAIAAPAPGPVVGDLAADLDRRFSEMTAAVNGQLLSAAGMIGRDLKGKIESEVAAAKTDITAGIQAYVDAQLTKRFRSEIVIRKADGGQHVLEGEYLHPATHEVLELAQLGIIPLMVGPAGSGKSVIGHMVAKILELDYSDITGSVGVTEGHFLGRREPNDLGGFSWVAAPYALRYEHGGVFLIDECDGLDPNVFMALNNSLSNGHLTIPNRPENPRAVRHENFIPLCAANTFGTGADRVYAGRNQLDGATLNRFQVVEVDYDRDLERRLCPDEEVLARFWGYRKGINANRLERICSTRNVIRAFTLKNAGWSWDRIDRAFFAGWSADEVSRVKGH